MRNTMRRWCGTLGLALVLGGCFDGEALTEGKLCRKNTDCGGTLLCKPDASGVFVCGGEMAMESVGSDPCEVGTNVCVDSSTLAVCDLGLQMAMTVECDDACQQRGFSASIGCYASLNTGFDCYCDETSFVCSTPQCSGGVLFECNGTEVVPSDCDGLCVGQVAGYCDATPDIPDPCNCSPGTCSEGATYCVDDDKEMRCMGGLFVQNTCSAAACQQLRCPTDYNSCPETYVATSLGCGFISDNGTMGCRCTD